LRILMQRKHAHHKARRAKAALRAVALHQRFLRGMQLPLAGEIFNRCELQPFNRMRKANAAVDGLEFWRSRLARITKGDHAGAAVAFVAAFFRTQQMQVFPNELQERACGWYILYLSALALVQKAKWFDVHHIRLAQTIRSVIPVAV
jgi:hypothetical protein